MSLAAILINLGLLISDGALTLLQLILHALDVLLLAVSVGDLSVEVLVLLLDLVVEVLLFLLFVFVLIANQSQLTLLLHTLVDFHGELLFVLLFNCFNFFPGLIFDLLTIVFMLLNHLFDL